MKETFAPVLLRRKAARIRKETGNTAVETKLKDQKRLKEEFKIALVRPMKLLLFAPVVTLLALYVAVEYGIMYLLFTTFPLVYESQYGFSAGTSGLSYIPIGVGTMLGVVLFGRISDTLVKRSQSSGKEYRPETRLAPTFTIPFSIAMPAGLFLYGWTTEKQVHWIASMIGTAMFGGGLMAVMVRRTFEVVGDSLTLDVDVCSKLSPRCLP